MYKLVIIATIVSLVLGGSRHPVNPDIVDAIKEQTSLWETYEYDENPFRDYSISDIYGMLGTTIKEDPIEALIPSPNVVSNLPKSFDSRDKWGNCIHPIRDQKKCGSCWAFAASEALSDRFCLASNQQIDVVLSPQDLVSCDWWDHGCSGGIISWAWSYMTSHGLVSESCFPYES